MRWLAFLALTFGSSGIAQQPAASQTVVLAEKDAIVFDDEFMPLFRAELPFILDYVGTRGQIFETRNTWVRISQDGKKGVWLNCNALGNVSSCVTSKDKSPKRTLTVRSAGIPTCPGDPRCPKKDSK